MHCFFSAFILFGIFLHSTLLIEHTGYHGFPGYHKLYVSMLNEEPKGEMKQETFVFSLQSRVEATAFRHKDPKFESGISQSRR